MQPSQFDPLSRFLSAIEVRIFSYNISTLIQFLNTFKLTSALAETCLATEE